MSGYRWRKGETQACRSAFKLGTLMGSVIGHGVLMIPCGRYTNMMRVMPSLMISRARLHKGLDVFGEGLASLTQ